METQELSQLYWSEFLDALNEKLDNNDVLIVVRNVEGAEQSDLSNSSLLSVDYDKDSDEISVLLFGKDFAVKGVKSIEAEFDCDELSGLEIGGKGGCSCLIRFNHPIHLPRAALAA